MRRMVTHAKLALDHDCHSLRRPDLATEAESFGPTSQQGGQLSALFGGQFRLRAGGRMMSQRLDPFSFGATDPLANGTGADAEGRRNLALRPALLSKLPSAQSTTFAPVAWWFCSCWSHTIYDNT